MSCICDLKVCEVCTPDPDPEPIPIDGYQFYVPELVPADIAAAWDGFTLPDVINACLTRGCDPVDMARLVDTIRAGRQERDNTVTVVDVMAGRGPLSQEATTGADIFQAGDHVRSIASRNDSKRRTFGVCEVNKDGTLHLWAHSHGHIYKADPRKWERLPRIEELQCAA